MVELLPFLILLLVWLASRRRAIVWMAGHMSSAPACQWQRAPRGD